MVPKGFTMKYEEAVQYIEDTRKYGSELGLERMLQLMEQLGNPQDRLRFIHIAGTNGKGSVLAYNSTILSCAGYRTGSYSSPALTGVREQFQIDGRYIREEQYADCVSKLKEAVLQMKSAGMQQPTVFELETALAFLYFEESNCDIVVLETGLGGLTDATNVIRTTVLSVITSISMDHSQILGCTLGEIAAQKAGIIKQKVPVVLLENNEDVTGVILNKCREMQSELFIAKEEKLYNITYGFPIQQFSYGGLHDVRIAIGGRHQVMNAALAIEAVQCLTNRGFCVSTAAIIEGLSQTKWPFRMEQILDKPQFVVDGAHNPDAAVKLMDSVEFYFKGRPHIFIMGVFKDKEYHKICKTAAGSADYIITVQTPDSERALPAEELRAAAACYSRNVEAAENLEEAVEKSFALAASLDRQSPIIIAFGSLAYLPRLKEAVMKKSRSVGKNGQE